ncbi:MAG TPA: hypothetical protein VFA80_11500 [Xanthobacteraceae bacterium]|nr:hypothetical protein [Xanthobacteraceae bacterium]
MSTAGHFRKLNEAGLEQFSNWLLEGAPDPVPSSLLADPQTSVPLHLPIQPEARVFGDRYEFGQYLNELLDRFEVGALSRDRGLWSALALFWFDQLCPLSSGRRNVEKEYRYVLSSDFRHYYRHLVRSPWQLVRDHGENSKFLLLPPVDAPHPLRRHGEILEQLGGRQAVLRSRPVIAEASRLYSDARTGRPLRGVSGSGKGSVRRLALVLQQLDLTYDCEGIQTGGLLKLLPSEFDRWRAHAREQTRTADTLGPTPEETGVLILGG